MHQTVPMRRGAIWYAGGLLNNWLKPTEAYPLDLIPDQLDLIPDQLGLILVLAGPTTNRVKYHQMSSNHIKP